MDVWVDGAQDFPLCNCRCVSLQPSLVYVNQPKERVTGKAFHIVIAKNICVN
jgi:hypothetical protein